MKKPMRKLIEARGKVMLIGCVAESPRFSTVHMAQFGLGLTQRHYNRLFCWSRFRDEKGAVVLFRPIASPGVSRAFRNFIPDYLESQKLRSLRCLGAAYCAAF